MIHTRLILLLVFISNFTARADEGMWMPLMLEKYTLAQMQAKGFRLSADDVYSINQASLKDAVVIFGRGCTGEVVSDQGLVLTNHHCGLDVVQSHSSTANDYLANGFWAMNRQEELINPGLSVTFLKRMEDVTQQVLANISDTLSEERRQSLIDKNIATIKAKTMEASSQYKADIKPYFHGNQYFLHIYEVFEDVRLVGAPPAAIGKFGGDTDNWMWPRHTGDFCVFRIYANANNQPAAYSPDNIPYRPAKHFDISLNGVQPNDFTMVFGFPGNTYQYVPSYHIAMLKNDIYPLLIDIRKQKLNIIKQWMGTSRDIRIKYTAKDATIANTWKRWIGETRGLEKLNTIAIKQTHEQAFTAWAQTGSNTSYTKLLPAYEKLYADYTPFRLAENYLMEMIWRNGMEVVDLAGNCTKYIELINAHTPDTAALSAEKQRLTHLAHEFFKDYHAPLDQQLTTALLTAYRHNLPEQFQPTIYPIINKHYKGNIAAYVNQLFSQSHFTSQASFIRLLNHKPTKVANLIANDPARQLYQSFYNVYANHVYPSLKQLNSELNQLNRQFMAAQMAFEPNKNFYPDANFTLRVAYGNVQGYHAADAVTYNHLSTIEGIIEKEDTTIFDYQVPPRLKALYQQKDFGNYGINGTLPVCFVATNHTTGGNSGSPVLNAHGQLIGINFDRAWEGVMSDLMFNPQQSRNIAVDIRYVLWVIDKYAGAGYLINEMNIIKN
jgi:hypothetical protein